MATILPPTVQDELVAAFMRDVDRTLLRENLRLSVEERLLHLQHLQEFAEGLRKAGLEARGKP